MKKSKLRLTREIKPIEQRIAEKLLKKIEWSLDHEKGPCLQAAIKASLALQQREKVSTDKRVYKMSFDNGNRKQANA